MSYRNIIADNCKNHSVVSWWPRFAYHYTDITNAVNILSSGFIYSRLNAQQSGVMKNDNASRQVIDVTNFDTVSSVRFYFRPMTPTQYYNEGYKHYQLRYDNDTNANTPVPVFFLFDLEKILSKNGVKFSERGQAGNGSELFEGEEAFSKLNFDNIYSVGGQNIEEVKSYRHAEINYPGKIEIAEYISFILCRNEIEKTSLLNMLRKTNPKQFALYRNLIKVCKQDMFLKNGLFITDCRYYNRGIVIKFADTYNKKYYTSRQKAKNSVKKLTPVKLMLTVEWFNARRIVEQKQISTEIDYEEAKPVNLNGLIGAKEATSISIKVEIDGNTMCYIEQPIDSSVIIR